jgi:hypothetical protein
VVYNLLTNGAFMPAANPTVFMGAKTVLPPDMPWGSARAAYSQAALPYNAFFFLEDIFACVPDVVRFADGWRPPVDLYLYDLSQRQQIWKVGREDGRVTPWKPFLAARPTRKYPYVCGSDGALLRASGYPQGIVANFVTAHFETSGAQRVGDDICSALSRVVACLGVGDAPPDLSQAPAAWKQQCAGPSVCGREG